MNDPNKSISVNLSSLLSLKAELQRKQHEVKLAKAAKTPANEYRPNKAANERDKTKSSSSGRDKKQNYTEISRSDEVKVYEAEDYAQLEKSRRVLEAKSKFYDRMSRSGGSLNSDDNCLVMFNRKRQEQQDEPEPPAEPRATTPRERRVSSSSDSDSSDESVAGNDEDEVEYVDCLGRTRKCLRKELTEAKRRDKQLADSMPERLDQTKANWMIDVKGNLGSNHNSDIGSNASGDDEPSYGPRPTESVFSDALSTMTKHDEQRMNWERKEVENVDKPDVHYQDVFFDEARTHGVGYYAFSTDEAERKQQQRELEQARKATQSEQKRRDDLRAQRDKIVADRVFAAKNRIRARNGLPPISKEDYEREEQLKKDEAAAETAEREREQKQKADKVSAEKAAEEAEREELRKEHIRDWDRDKSGVAKKHQEQEQPPEEWHYKAERLPMSQEQWNEQQRAVRAPEFAPMPEAPLKRTNFSSMPPPSALLSDNREFSNFHTTKREKQFQRRNYTPDVAEELDEEPSSSSRSQGAAIPPPDCLDSSAPSLPKRPKTQEELERSITAGLKFLRDNCDKGVLGNKGTWTAKADY
ncbi:coiled-coil domain-containing protein 174 [Drosophila sulfurigaster albostrigata]|uniref:coiled-coil domain-containing protein 174 n=1 Tax=Drosophila sulfurigaster albostrigata TaxID=89887 RepID=UPI002D21C553|nr:coiled-coil domain-containing protein 174 [Drosophila sulfurigaster albostrigata]